MTRTSSHMRPSRRHGAMRTVLSNVPLMLAIGCSTSLPQSPLSQFCPADLTPGSGNMDKPSGVALAIRTRDNGIRNAYAVAVNPDQRQARAADLTAGLMVPAPNVYFPMAVKLGSFTESVAASSDGTLAVALDPQDRTLKFFDVGGASEDNAWKQTGDLLQNLDQRPTGLAVRGTRDDLTVAISHAGDPVGSVTFIKWSQGVEQSRRRINLGGRPSSVSLSEDAQVAVVSNAEGNSIFVLGTLQAADPALPLQPCGATQPRPCAVDVGGPTNHVVTGLVPSRPENNATLYPVALALRFDQPAVSVVRLQFAPGAPRDAALVRARDEVEAVVMLPRFPSVAALAPHPSPLCCSGAPFFYDPAALAQGGFAYALVAMVDGSIIYLDLNARDPLGRRMPRLMDKNSTPPGILRNPDNNCAPMDLNQACENYLEPPDPQADAGVATPDGGNPACHSSRRPQVQVELGSDAQGNLVNQLLDEDYLFTWEGVVPGTQQRHGHASAIQLAQDLVEDDLGVDFRALGVHPGDHLVIPVQEGCACPAADPACTSAADLEVLAVAGATLRLGGLYDVRQCAGQDSGFFFRIRAHNRFVVRGGLTGRDYGRAAFFERLELPGATLTLWPAGYQAGQPARVTGRDGGVFSPPDEVMPIQLPPVGSMVAVPVRSHFDPFVLDADDALPDQGRIFSANSVPTGLVTGLATVSITSSSTSPAVADKAIGVMSTAGGGLLLQFDLAVHPDCPTPGPATCSAALTCPGTLSRSVNDIRFRFFE